MSAYTVGQRVWVYAVNRGTEPREVTVARVGRKLVYITDYGREDVYRIEDGQRNDGYSHSYLLTDEARVDREARTAATERLRVHGVNTESRGLGKLSTDGLNAVADILDAEVSK